MPHVDGPRRARADEFPELLDLVDRCFRKQRGDMAARLPFVYDAERPDRHAIVRHDGEVVAHVAAIPQTLVVGDEVACPGISGVATDPRHRGEGHMSKLLEFWLDELDVPLLELGGDRVRYGRFGWENGGREIHYRITTRSLSTASPDVPLQVYEGTDEQVARLRTLHASEPYRVKRRDALRRKVYKRADVETLLSTGEAPAYLCVNRTGSEPLVREFGGSAHGVEGLLAAAFDRLGLDAVTVPSPPRHELAPTLRRLSSSWRQTPLRKLNIRSLVGTLSGFAAQMTRSLADSRVAPDSVVLGVADTDEQARVHYDGETVSVEATTDAPDVALSRRELTLFLFGGPDQAPEHREHHPLLNACCPLTFYIWSSERV